MKLIEATQVGDITVQNRVFMAPLTRSRADNPAYKPTDIHATYYAQRAGAGLIISEATVVSEQGRGYVNTPGIYSQEQVEGWKKVTEAVHAKGGKIYVQLWHVGRVSHPSFHGGALPVAPSAINPEMDVFTTEGMTKTVTPKALEVAEIKAIVQDFKRAGENALAAGFDGVEVHGANSYLLQQFFNGSSNTRTDAYGGSDENKTRILIEILDALLEIMPASKIGLRLSPMTHGSGGIEVDEQTVGTYNYIIEQMNGYNLAYLHFLRHNKDLPHGLKDEIGHYRALYKGFLIANAGYDAKTGQAEIESGRADAIAYGRPYIANPDLAARLEHGWPLAETDQSTWYAGGEKGFLDYPAYQEA
ncbi:MAG: alkene reductase [Aureispira sp.]